MLVLKQYICAVCAFNTGWTVYRVTGSQRCLGDGSTALRESVGSLTLRLPTNRTDTVLQIQAMSLRDSILEFMYKLVI